MTAIFAALATALETDIVTLQLSTLGDYKVSPTTAVATITLQRNGDLAVAGNLSDTPDALEWAEPRSTTVGDDYEARMTVNSGDSPSGGTVGSWLALSSDRAWAWVQSSIGVKNINVGLEIRKASSGKVLGSTTITGTVTMDTL